MAMKRKREDAARPDGDHKARKRAKKGFVVGPDNLPDGPWKRKTQKIKRHLIDRANVQKEYARFQRQGKLPTIEDEQLPEPATREHDPVEDVAPPNTDPHPDRQKMMDEPLSPQDLTPGGDALPGRRIRRPKPVPLRKDYELGQKRKAEAEERHRAREEANRQRKLKLEERERFRKAMAKARSGGFHGQRKLGRESGVLLEKVKRMVGSGK